MLSSYKSSDKTRLISAVSLDKARRNCVRPRAPSGLALTRDNMQRAGERGGDGRGARGPHQQEVDRVVANKAAGHSVRVSRARRRAAPRRLTTHCLARGGCAWFSYFMESPSTEEAEMWVQILDSARQRDPNTWKLR